MRGPESLGPKGARLRATLEASFAPIDCQVVDESHKHEGHAGARPEGETHFRVRMTSAAFAGKSRIERQRMVHRALAGALEDHLHALSLDLAAPGDG